MNTWTPLSWQNFHNSQPVDYDDKEQLQEVLNYLARTPELIAIAKIDELTECLAKAAQGQAFILQGGDCAERFVECIDQRIQSQVRLLQILGNRLQESMQLPVVLIGRIAGQFAKPRSSLVEAQGTLELPSYRGDLINSDEYNLLARTPDPARMQLAYHYTRRCLAAIESLALNLYTSHEALHLLYESSLTRRYNGDSYYNISTHYPWVGMRTSDLNSAQIEYARGINNPIAVKLGPQVTPEWVQGLAKRLNPNRIAGKLSFIHRLGTNKIAALLPELIAAVRETQIPVVWICDPMHGNTWRGDAGYKIRSINCILDEFAQAVSIHQQYSSHLAGIHLELTGDKVAECMGGRLGYDETHLAHGYRSLVDPRLNAEQANEVIEGFINILAKYNVIGITP